ncbi:MAG: lysophospholipid acyltransferase family protein [Bernardetiaceae bacterium]
MDKLVTKQDLKETDFNSLKIPFVNDLVMWMLKIRKINSIYDRLMPRDGIAFIDGVLEELNIRYTVSEEELAHIPTEGPFLTVSNHPFGILDGMILIKIIAERRPDFKVMANFLIQKVDPIQDFVIAVNPFENHQAETIRGLRQALVRLESGHPVGIFPAGEVSTRQRQTHIVEDREWTKTSLKLIRRAGVPVVPIYFQGTNSFSFHVLGKILPALRTAALPSELLNKKDQTLPLRIGRPIPFQELESFGDLSKMGRYLRTMVYGLGSALEVKKFFRHGIHAKQRPETIVDPIATDVLCQEIEQLRQRKDCFLGTKKQFDIFLAPAQAMPQLMHELGRCREVTFRAVGEGSNRKMDVDEFDLYYKHLFLWDKEEKRIAGAYRLGFGDQIMKQHGRRGFYISSLFDLDRALKPTLAQSLELGRSFVMQEYQRRPMPLFILWQGILDTLIQHPHFKYIIGPVSISNSYSKFSKELLIAFIQKYYFNHELAAHVRPKNAFSVSTHIDSDILLEKFKDNVNELDKYIAEFEPDRFRVPILLKKYMKQNAQIIGFNIDPRFNNSLDGLMILDLKKLPDSTFENLRKKAYEQG